MDDYILQKTTIWSFPDRGNWATHRGDYRGNWSPHVPRNLILKYTKEENVVLDCFVGSGTTLIECKLLNRNGIGIDINMEALNIAKKRLKFPISTNVKMRLIHGNATNLHMLADDSIDFICTHPPYANIIHYSNDIDGDLSNLEYEAFLDELTKVANELYRVLKKGHYCSFMIGDIRKYGNVIPLGFLSMQIFLDVGFQLREIIIKEQHNCSSSAYWKDKNYDFYLIAHEYIFVMFK
ncbi:MAG: methyltransferase domain-containing protein [Erysipelotrichaceae bacterium]|nr:methyltransferase domain-containing protein [Erysipelotrichaceae bacterium]